ncbi:MAG: hypothetical protein A2Y00_03440 [Omnitrophica WOR_2 bacterium GWF2_43_52]|nr:MAG: hypothetical protein A2Y01_00025 [Omnitrophica WOR_2 bacterium GWC2_44_8]OGX22488.1 MAG: hypothetical protein A2Y00_03440 [Omnitrophica WOR_2 bacterium GWF2_43_52]HAH21510.1 hypothetical protein [Candidatus Omnitrophota bacterium]HBG64575.1 hypothetical protein [Candidatus Omnitrophota bacterium]HCD38104.1 hypothetical protein [Candidatus Omnitrophota bacterium]
MILKRIAGSSALLSYLRKIQHTYLRLEDTCGKFYQNSRVHKVCARLWQGTRKNLKHSFLGKITEPGNCISPSAFEESRSVKWIVGKYRFWTRKIQSYFSSSALKGAIENLKQDFYAAPVMTGSIVILIALLTNIFLSILFHRDINFWGWLIRIVFLVVSFGGLFCKADWKKIEKGSFILQRINKKTEQER